MKTRTQFIVIAPFVLFLLLVSCRNAPRVVPGSLPRSIPEAEGIASADIIAFLDSAAVSINEFHSILILRHGKVVAEGWWSPYKPELRHTLYSTSKSFTSTAIGFAVNEKLITTEDKVISFFPDYLPDSVSPFLAGLTIQHLLMMSAGQDPDPTSLLWTASDSIWARLFLNTPIVNKPGSTFLYNSLATYMLSAIVQKVTGEKVIDYLTPRLFEPLGINGIDWETDPMGINTGGWGLRLKTEDMAKFGQLYLQKGMWNGKQIIPSSWVEEATSFKIDQAPDAPQADKESSDWMQGYGYQFWRCRNNAYRADGAYGQYIIVLPEKDAVVAITSETPNMQDVLNMVWKYLLPAMKDGVLPANDSVADLLKERLSKLAILPDSSLSTPAIAERVNGKKYILEENFLGMQTITFGFADNTCKVVMNNDSLVYNVKFGSEKWIEDETEVPGPSLTGPLGGATYKTASACAWKGENTLTLTLRYIESPHHFKIDCTFDNDALTMVFWPSMAFGQQSYLIKGKAE